MSDDDDADEPRRAILLIEDEELDARVFMRALRDHDVTWASDLDGARDLLADRSFDLVALDLHLGDTRPRQAATFALAAAQETPVMVLTGVEDTALASELLRLGVEDYVAKADITPSGLERRVLLTIERARLQTMRSNPHHGTTTRSEHEERGDLDHFFAAQVSSGRGVDEFDSTVDLHEDVEDARRRAQAREPLMTPRVENGGVRIGDRYELVRNVGAGSAGAVYLARDTVAERDVALKLMHSWLTDSREMRRRFQLEAATQASLKHPNIVRVLDAGESQRRCYIVSDYAEYGSLKDRFKLGSPQLSFWAALHLLLPVVEGVAHAHSHDVVHRDIKPGNILLARTPTGPRAQLTDFGVARLVPRASDTKTGVVVGTLRYIAPEQLLDSKSADHRADIFSLAATLYEAFTRAPLSEPGRFGERDALRPAHEVSPDVPAAIGTLLAAALDTEPTNRPETCAVFAQRLREAAASVFP